MEWNETDDDWLQFCASVGATDIPSAYMMGKCIYFGFTGCNTRAAGDALRRGREVDDWGFFLSLSVAYKNRLARWKLFQCQGHLDVRGGGLNE